MQDVQEAQGVQDVQQVEDMQEAEALGSTEGRAEGSKTGLLQAASFDSSALLAKELSLPRRSIKATLDLLYGGASVPFIARYRKEATGGLDEVQIRAVEERSEYLAELDGRRQVVLRTIEEQGKLSDDLRAKIEACTTKNELEDLYLPYKPKRRTKASIARERGLEPLALRILEQPLDVDVESEAQAFVDQEKGVASPEEALNGACDIVVETVVENADVRAEMRRVFGEQGVLRTWSLVEDGKRTKFEDYYDHSEPVAKVPSHRYLAIRRGEAEGVLATRIEVDEERQCGWIEHKMGLNEESPMAERFRHSVKQAFTKRLSPSIQTDVRVELKIRADREAVDVFAKNLENRLLEPPLGARPVVGVDPGLRTGCKCVAVDGTGRFLSNITIYPSRGKEARSKAAEDFVAFCRKHDPFAVAVGNGTAGRETLALVKSALADAGLKTVVTVSVNEAGASVYSASDVARQEFPDLDVTVRGAISIARRLQDPLAELVKIEPKSIGVGQYQHDVDQKLLDRKLGEVIESCVNRVGVELSTASAFLLQHVAGVGSSVARNIVAHREAHGPFPSRKALLKVKGIGPKAYEQAAGFLRVRESSNPLDHSAVHPERYGLVERMAADLGVALDELVGNETLVKKIDWRTYMSPDVGEPTLKDIMTELAKPGRDPRASFDPVQFRDDVQTINDLEVGMLLDGVVTNVTNFGAFVDIGVHQDGLVHISQLSDQFVRDPHEVVRVGDRVKVRVLDVDQERNRIGLTARTAEPVDRHAAGDQSGERSASGQVRRSRNGGGSQRSERRGDRSDGRDRRRGGGQPGGGDGRSNRDARNGRGSHGQSGKQGVNRDDGFGNRPFEDLFKKR